MRGRLFILLFCSAICSFSQVPNAPEFRGVWIATAYHIDWPQQRRMLPSQQRQDFIEILDFYQSLDFNAVFVQVRVAGDAFYESSLAPWSEFLSGVEGVKGDWEEDPLVFMVRETKARGMEFHAWLNPYRVTLGGDPSLLDDKHIWKRHPEWCVLYGRSYFLDPGLPAARAHVVSIVEELIDKYPIDGVHFDDYFYPYPIAGLEFNDRSSFVTHGLGDFEEREAWRRANVDSLILSVDRLLESKRRDVLFGVSPFGIWRNASEDPRAPNVDRTISTYDHLFADPLTWAEEGWVDYLVPQLYWKTTDMRANFTELARWWDQAVTNTPIYLGNALYQVHRNSSGAENDEIKRQLLLGRRLPNVDGHVFFSARSLMDRPALARQLRATVYQSSRASSNAD